MLESSCFKLIAHNATRKQKEQLLCIATKPKSYQKVSWTLMVMNTRVNCVPKAMKCIQYWMQPMIMTNGVIWKWRQNHCDMKTKIVCTQYHYYFSYTYSSLFSYTLWHIYKGTLSFFYLLVDTLTLQLLFSRSFYTDLLFYLPFRQPWPTIFNNIRLPQL